MKKFLIIAVVVLAMVSAVSIPYCVAAANTDTPSAQFGSDSNIWKTKYLKHGKVILKYLSIMNDDGMSLYFCSYQDEKVEFVALGLTHFKETLKKSAELPMYKSSDCCWNKVKYFNGDQGISFMGNSWAWILNSKNGLTIDTNIVDNIIDNNQIKWSFDTEAGRKESGFKFSEHQAKNFGKLIEWLLKEEGK